MASRARQKALAGQLQMRRPRQLIPPFSTPRVVRPSDRRLLSTSEVHGLVAPHADQRDSTAHAWHSVRSSASHPAASSSSYSSLSSSSSSDAHEGFFTSRNRPESSRAPGSGRVSDHEYEVRVGRAYDLLRATLPDFMRIGLVDYGESSEPKPRASSMTLLDVLAFRSLRDRAAQDGLLGQTERQRAADSEDARRLPLSSQDPSDVLPSYHDDIHFRFCAHASTSASSPTSDLTDEEAASLSFSGRNLYFASAQMLRHTLNILFSDAQVTIESIRRERRGATAAGEAARKRESSSKDEGGHGRPDGLAQCSSSRGDVIHVRVGFVGHLRVTGAEHRYTVKFRYDFDEDSGRIISHTVERIEPAIGRKLWSGLAAVWLRITGHQFPHAQPVANVLPATAHTDVVRSRLPFERK